MEWFDPLSARVTVVAAEIAPPAGEMVGAILVTGVMVVLVKFPLWVGIVVAPSFSLQM
jgi:hypothetical protein